MSQTTSGVLLSAVSPVDHGEAMTLARAQNEAFLADLRALEPAEWERPTDCTGWSVRDIAAHILGWAEALTSPREGLAQSSAAWRRRGGFSNLVDAQNEVQVDARRWLATDELLERLDRSFPRFEKVRDRAGRALRKVPYLSGPTGWTNIGFIADHIFTRDVLMHRIDIARAVGRELNVGAAERRIIEDCLREWAESSGADATLELTGAAAGCYVAGAGSAATISGDSIDLLRYYAGRGSFDVFEVQGHAEQVKAWLDTGPKF